MLITITRKLGMKHFFGLLLSLMASLACAQVTQGPVTVFSGPRWIVTNSTVAPADLFYVGLSKTSYNVAMLDFSLNPQASPRFSTFGDLGPLTRGAPDGADINTFIGWGYVFQNASAYSFTLHDVVGSVWICSFDASASGFCSVFTSTNRSLGKVYFRWNP